MWDIAHPMIRFELGQHGWSDIFLESKDAKHEIRITHIFDDPLEKLIQFAEDVHLKKYPAKMVFQDEPGSTTLELTVSVDQGPSLVLSQSENTFPELGQSEPIASYKVVPSFVTTQIVAELMRTEQLLRHEVFSEHRSDFPWKRYAQMKTRLALDAVR